MNKKILVSVPFFEQRCKRAFDLLRDNGYEIIAYQGDTVMTFEEIKTVGLEICGVIAGCDVWNEELFEYCTNLRVIARFGVGVDGIDLEAAKRHGVKVCNAKGMNCGSVGEATIMFALASLRNLVSLTNTTKAGQWERFTGRTLSGKIYGLIGFGAIAQYVAELLQSFGLKKILAYDIYKNREAAKRLNVEFVEFETLLREADVISLHVPYTAETTKLIGEAELQMMKTTAVLINMARGPIIDETALYYALKKKEIAVAAVDVFTAEPTAKENPLLSLNNLICMPHLAADTYESFDMIACFCAQVIFDVMEGAEPANWLNP